VASALTFLDISYRDEYFYSMDSLLDDLKIHLKKLWW